MRNLYNQLVYPNIPYPAEKSAVRIYHLQPGNNSLVESLHLIFLELVVWEAADSYGWPTHRHSAYEIIVPLIGTYCCTLNETRLELTPGKMLFIKPGDLHEDDCKKGIRYLAMEFKIENRFDEGSPIDIFHHRIPPGKQIIDVNTQLIDQVIDRMGKEVFQSPEKGIFKATHIQNALLLAFVWEHIGSIDDRYFSERFRQLGRREAFQHQMEEVFAGQIKQDLDLERIAGEMGMSSRNLNHKCRTLLGSSAWQLFNRFRIRQAIHLLHLPQISIKEVSYRLGFKNPYHFSRVFRQIESCSPSEFRTRLKEENADPSPKDVP